MIRNQTPSKAQYNYHGNAVNGRFHMCSKGVLQTVVSFQVISKLHVAETTIDSLNQQLVELSRSESLTRAKEQHESVVNVMKRRHEEEVLTLKQKLDEAVLSRDHKVPFLSTF